MRTAAAKATKLPAFPVMAASPSKGEAQMVIFMTAMVKLVAQDGPDLTSRQLAVLTSAYHAETPMTVRGLATHLNISKPAITRALDRLGELEMLKRIPDPLDRRSVLVGKTQGGTMFLRGLRETLAAAAQ
jgi:DNA-binding MarR family transcriptional regulator